ncbi:type II secretion system F family protein [Halomicroarcula sp. GCM10025817]|uniref:type II secretion system F family protein n=1 Tax=Halomicroarcula sp. GCM10025817 TaxID=3252672 RepID=UPI00360CA1D2
MALNPLGLTPLALLVVLLSVVGLGFVSEPWDRRLTRFSRRLFGRYVGASPERKRVLESAYIGETYRGYAARTYLFTAIAAVCGALGGAYLVGLLLLAIPTIVDLLLGLPNTMVNALGIRGFELVLAPTRTLAVLAAGGVFTGAGAAGLTYILRWELPKNTAAVRRRNIEEGMPRNIAFMYALARGGMSFPDIVRVLGRNQDIYGDMSREISIAVREMDLFGRDVISSLQHVSHRTPSEKMKTFTENLSSVLQSGQSLESFLRDQYERHQEDAAQRQADIIESLATIAEAYVTIFVAGVLFLITILLVFGLTTTDTLPFLQLLAYLAIPLANAGFMVYLSSKMEALGISDSGTTDVLDRLETTTFGKPAVRPETGVTDGGHVDTATDNWARLRLYDRVRRVKRILRSPVETLVWNPTQVLYVAVPVAVLAFALRAPAAFQTSIVNVRLLDDLLVQSALLVLGAFAVVRFVYVRRVARIEQATPELLERLASLNEAGMTIVESIRRVRGNDVGVLTPEVKRIWADIRMGANVDDALVRFGRRIKTTAIIRVVTLLIHSMRASGELGPVLRIAATQARSELQLRKRRRQQMLTYLVVIYISFLVFLVIIVAVQEVLVPALPSDVPTPVGSANRLGVGVDQFARFGRVDKAAYTLVFFHTALIQAVLTGFIGGQLGEGTLKDGAKHAAVLLGVAYVAFLLLSSPVASLTVADQPVDGGELTVESASLSDGGFVVVHESDTEGPVVGTSGYLQAGTHRDLRISLDGSVNTGTPLVLVVHQDTNGNQALDYDFEGAGGPDQPYAATGNAEFVTVELTVE